MKIITRSNPTFDVVDLSPNSLVMLYEVLTVYLNIGNGGPVHNIAAAAMLRQIHLTLQGVEDR